MSLTSDLSRIEKEIESCLLEAATVGELTPALIAAINSYVAQRRSLGEQAADIMGELTRIVSDATATQSSESARFLRARALVAGMEAAYLP